MIGNYNIPPVTGLEVGEVSSVLNRNRSFVLSSGVIEAFVVHGCDSSSYAEATAFIGRTERTNVDIVDSIGRHTWSCGCTVTEDIKQMANDGELIQITTE